MLDANGEEFVEGIYDSALILDSDGEIYHFRFENGVWKGNPDSDSYLAPAPRGILLLDGDIWMNRFRRLNPEKGMKSHMMIGNRNLKPGLDYDGKKFEEGDYYYMDIPLEDNGTYDFKKDKNGNWIGKPLHEGRRGILLIEGDGESRKFERWDPSEDDYCNNLGELSEAEWAERARKFANYARIRRYKKRKQLERADS